MNKYFCAKKENCVHSKCFLNGIFFFKRKSIDSAILLEMKQSVRFCIRKIVWDKFWKTICDWFRSIWIAATVTKRIQFLREGEFLQHAVFFVVCILCAFLISGSFECETEWSAYNFKSNANQLPHDVYTEKETSACCVQFFKATFSVAFLSFLLFLSPKMCVCSTALLGFFFIRIWFDINFNVLGTLLVLSLTTFHFHHISNYIEGFFCLFSEQMTKKWAGTWNGWIICFVTSRRKKKHRKLEQCLNVRNDWNGQRHKIVALENVEVVMANENEPKKM